MKSLPLVVLVALLPAAAALSTESNVPIRIFVAPSGNDNWSGRSADPRDDGSDGPLATLPAAQRLVRDLRNKSWDTPIEVVLRGGTYRLEIPLEFTSADSGRSNAMVTWKAFADEQPVISGAAPLEGWMRPTAFPQGLPEVARTQVWVAEVPPGRNFFTLLHGDTFLPRARSGDFETDTGAPTKDRDFLTYLPGDLPPFASLAGVEVHIQPRNWVVHYLPVDRVDQETRRVYFSVPGTYVLDTVHRAAPETDGDEWVYRFENAPELLDQPGEWFLDTAAGKLYLWPPDSHPPTDIAYPNLTKLVHLHGDADTRDWTRFLVFDGLTFSHADRLTWNDGRVDVQHGWDTTHADYAAMVMEGAYDITVRNCRFVHSAGSGIKMVRHAVRNRVVHNLFSELGGSAVSLVGFGSGNRDENFGHLIANNEMRDFGLFWEHSMGVYITNSGSNLIRNNHIHHTPYIAIAVVGGREGLFWPENYKNMPWDGGEYVDWEAIPEVLQSAEKWPHLLGYIHSRSNLIEHNDLHDLMLKLDDGNGIYLSGAGVGNVVRRNYVHDTHIGVSSAIRTDDSQFYARITENVIRNIEGGGLTCKLINEFDNNVVIDCSYSYCVIRGRPQMNPDNYGASLRRNIFVQTLGRQGPTPLIPVAPPFFYGPWWRDAKEEFKPVIIENNLFWVTDDPAAAGEALAISREDLGKNTESIAADPGFFNLAAGDLRFDETSPAWRLGIKPIESYGLIEPVGPKDGPKGDG